MIPQAKSGQIYVVQDNLDGSFTLIAIDAAESAAPKSRLGEEGGFTVVIPGQPINEAAIKELLADFP